MSNYKQVINSGSAIGEAIGASMERALEKLLVEITDSLGFHYITSGVRKTKNGKKAKKLLMSDNYGNEYNIDGVIANESMQPLILFESKYIRYKKHNRDKGSWICTAHSAVRRRYHSIRSSIAILAGSWSGSSQAMMKSHDINLFLIPFDHISDILTKLGVDFNWEEKDSQKAKNAWYNFNNLTTNDQDSIGEKMISLIKDPLISLIEQILDDTIERNIQKIIVEFVSNFGEVKVYEFSTIEEALDFFDQQDLTQVFLTTDSITLFEPPPEFNN